MRQRKNKVRGTVPPQGASADRVWSNEDNAALQKLLDPLRGENQPEIDVFGMFSSEARGLLCSSKHEVHDKMYAFLSTLNVMSGLVLSSIIGLVTNPMDVNSLPEDKQLLGNIFNVLAYTTVTTQVCTVMFSTYMLVIAVHAQTPDQTYRFIAHSAFMYGLLELAVYLPLLLALIMFVVSAHIHFSIYTRWICTGIVIAIYSLFHFAFVYCAIRGCPRGVWGWLGAIGPWMYWDSRAKADTKRMGDLYFAHTEKGVLAGKDTNHDGVVDSASEGPTPDAAELTAWIDKSLPKLFTGIRHTLLVRALVSEGLTLSTLSEAAELRGGFEVQSINSILTTLYSLL
jgi:hypothetical protein